MRAGGLREGWGMSSPGAQPGVIRAGRHVQGGWGACDAEEDPPGTGGKRLGGGVGTWGQTRGGPGSRGRSTHWDLLLENDDSGEAKAR